MLTALLGDQTTVYFTSQQFNFPSSIIVQTAALLGVSLGISPRSLAPARMMMVAEMSLAFCSGRADLAELPKREVPICGLHLNREELCISLSQGTESLEVTGE